MKFDLIILIIISFVSVESRRITPKADDLKDHFGYSPDYSPYGPSELKTVLLPTSIDPPFTEYYSEPIRIIRRKPIHLINPEIAKPKIHVVTHHRGIVYIFIKK